MDQDMNNGAAPTQKEPAGAMISIIIIVLVIIAGAYYFLKRVPATNLPTAQGEADALVATLSRQGTSDEISAIEQDLNATPDISMIGAGIGNLTI